MTASLAGRIDFEVARAMEWRGDRLSPLDADVPIEVEADRREDAPGVATARARALLARRGPSPGDVAVRAFAALSAGLVLFAGVAGVQVARLALGDPATGPVNVAWFAAHALGLQTALLILTLLLPALGPRLARRWLQGAASLGGLALQLAVRWGRRAVAAEGAPATTPAAERLRGAADLRPIVLRVSHGAWAAFNVTFLLAAGLILSAEHHAFAWQSTFVTDARTARAALELLCLPAAAWPGLPGEEQVRVSRYDPERRAYVVDAGDPDAALRWRQAWSAQLLVATAGWGLLPRLLLLAHATWRSRRALRRLPPEPSDPYVVAVVDRLAGHLDVECGPPAAAPAAPPAAAPAAAREGPPERWHVAAWLDAARGRDPVVALWGDRRERFHALPRLDGRRAEEAALGELEQAARDGGAPTGLVLLCDYGTTPDAGLGHVLERAARAIGAGATWIVLTGGGDFRGSRRGRAPGAVATRREVWTRSLAAWGIPTERIVDLDPESATPAARASLAARLGVAVPSARASSPAASFRKALELLEELSRTWSAEPAVATADREAVALRRAAVARGTVDGCFSSGANPADAADAAGAPALAAALRASLRLPEAELPAGALPAAAVELQRMGRILARLRRVSPRLVAAGLVAGLAAGPVGGALAAGTAGLVAGASLSTTLGALGAALGGAWSLRRSSDGSAPGGAETGAPEDDPLGLPVRTGAVRTVVLAHQGQGEPAIAAAVERLGACRPERLRSPEDVAAYLGEARREVAPP